MKEALQSKDSHGRAKQLIAQTGDRRDKARLKLQYKQWKELAKLSNKMGGLPELPFWKDLIYSNPESAARQFHEKMGRSSVKTRIRLQNILRQFDSIHTPSFKKEYRILRGEYPDRRGDSWNTRR